MNMCMFKHYDDYDDEHVLCWNMCMCMLDHYDDDDDDVTMLEHFDDYCLI